MTPDRIANAIMMDTSFTGHYLIVEGKKDVKLFGKFINELKVRIEPAFGNERVKELLNILDKRGFDKRLGVIDADFRNILNITENIDGLFITDEHDIEVMMIKTKALENVINLYCTKESIKKYERSIGISIREKIYSLGKEVGFIKLANNIYDLGLVFKPKNPEGNQIKYSKFICNTTLNFLGKDTLIDKVINYSRNKSENIKEKRIIIEKVQEIEKNDYEILQLINGHDISNFLYILFKKILKSKNKMLFDYNAIEDSLILAYELDYFRNTQLYKNIKDWGKAANIQIFI